MTTFRQLLEFFEESAKTQAAKGRRFEDFCAAFLRIDRTWSEEFDEVWTWQEWPGRPPGHPDTGIDLVAQRRGSGDLVAIQCKFYKPSAVLGWEHISTFVAMLSQDVFASGMVISTAGAESANLHKNVAVSPKPVVWWRVDDFEDSLVDWNAFRPSEPTRLALGDVKTVREYQRQAIDDVVGGLDDADRGQLVMACGTGKTFTSLRLAEQLVGKGGSVLFLVPSINLLSQTVIAWANDAQVPLATFAVCSDTHAGRRGDEDMSSNDLQIPASTNVDGLINAVTLQAEPTRMTVVFSTYQSIDVISGAQAAGLGRFDLIICDEAHRTTGSYRDDEDRSMFTKVHDDDIVGADKRLYMTATPRVYGEATKAKAKSAAVVVASMDDPERFGHVLHKLPFGQAVADGLLTDYKVLVLAVNEDSVSDAFQRQFAEAGHELPLNDVARMIGCWHGLSKRGPQFEGDDLAMKRAVAFSSTIKQSKRFSTAFPDIVNRALEDRSDRNAVMIEADHVDGSTNVKVRSNAIAWLEESPGQGVCRVLSNAKCLTEGVDVPDLDAVMFLNPRRSVVDVVQAVGRVMRLAEGKEFGYVILPIGIPGGMSPEEALQSNEKYEVVWQVLQALRSHDERLAAEINKIDINKKSSKVNVVGIGLAGGDSTDEPGVTTTTGDAMQTTLDLPDLDEWRDALYARIVDKVGDRQYMEHWAKNISDIATAQETRIRSLLDHPDQNPAAVERFDEFLTALRNNLNDSIDRDDAIGMLSQHLITRPVFEALFGGDEFTQRNPVSQVMQSMIDVLDDANLDSETSTLDAFYEHIRVLIGGIDTAEGRQKVIAELYERFFKRVVPKEAASLGIVYTPVEVVDFINRSVNDLLGRHFNSASLSDEGVHILDPFTGTGTFIARLIQSGLISPEALARKYKSELHANEIMLLAYYIAAINIETAYSGVVGDVEDYEPFDGIVLTDTFQLSEVDDTMDTVFFPRNNARADRQKELDIRVILGNPPYSGSQDSQNDDNANLKYPTLDATIERTYADRSSATLKNSLYNSYVRAFRWASNRLVDTPDGGIVGFVSNGGWIDDKSADGVRHTFAHEFHHIYVFNLRGNARTSGEQRKREKDNVFGSGSRNAIAVTLLVKQPGPTPAGGAHIHYRDIGDNLDRETKLAIVADASLDNIDWTTIVPNEHADWTRQRNPRYDELTPLAGEPDAIFDVLSNGLKTNRDTWVYNSSRITLVDNVNRMIDFYNSQLAAFEATHQRTDGALKQRSALAKAFVDKDPRKYSWDRGDFARMAAGRRYEFREDMLREGLYRPFFRQALTFGRTINNETYQLPKVYPRPETQNLGFSIVGQANEIPFACLATDRTPQFAMIGASSSVRHYARRRYEIPDDDATLLSSASPGGWVSNIRRDALARFQAQLGHDLTDDDVFFYVYGVLHSPDFRRVFEVNLKKEAPRIPLVEERSDFDAFVVAGRELCDLHVGYESVEPHELVEEWSDGIGPEHPDFSPERLMVGDKKMKYPKVNDSDPDSDTYNTKIDDKTRLVYNPFLTLSGIPLKAHDYILGTRSGVDWLIDRYYVKTDSKSGIVNDPNQWGLELGEPRYIIDLVKRVVTVSLRTVELVEALPSLSFD